MRWLLRNQIGGWEHFNIQTNLLMASLYILFLWQYNFIKTFRLSIYHNPVVINQCFYLCFLFEHMPSFEKLAIHCCCSVITQSFLFSFTGSSCMSQRHFLSSLEQRFSISPVYLSHPVPPSLQNSS